MRSRRDELEGFLLGYFDQLIAQSNAYPLPATRDELEAEIKRLESIAAVARGAVLAGDTLH